MTKTKPFKIEIDNTDESCRRFISSVIAIFTDPELVECQRRLREGRYVLKMAENGHAQFEDQDAIGGFKSITPPPLS